MKEFKLQFYNYDDDGFTTYSMVGILNWIFLWKIMGDMKYHKRFEK